MRHLKQRHDSMNLYDVFCQRVSNQPEHPALIRSRSGSVLSYAELLDAIDSVGEKLLRAGLKPRQCVGMHVPSGADYIILNYAVWRCGGCVVPVAPELATNEKRTISRAIPLEYVISTKEREPWFSPSASIGATRLLPEITVRGVDTVREHPSGFQEIDAAFLRFTSGTTADSKGVVLSHATIFDRISAANEVLHIGPGDRVIWLLSMSYHFAVSIVSYLSFGATIVLLPIHFAQEIIQALRDYEGTLIYGSPLHYAMMADSAQRGRFSKLRLALSTTASLNPETAERFRDRFELPLTQALGIIEVGLPCINVDFAADRCTAVGRPLPAYQLQIRDTGLGPNLGEIAFKGKGFFDAYYDPWQVREQTMPDGWFSTGDVGELDADGCLHLRGRSTDMINVAGMKLFPQEVETVLLTHQDVAEACVFAHPDDRFGEVPHAMVVAKAASGVSASEAALLRHCRGQLSDFKVPHQIRLVDALPRTASGKLLHRDVMSTQRDIRRPS